MKRQMKRQIPTPKSPTEHFSYWAALALLTGLLACFGAMIYISLQPVDIDDLIGSDAPIPEDPYSSTRIGIPENNRISVGDMLDDIWASTVWIGREAKPGVNIYVGTGWVIGNRWHNERGQAYIATCAHVATYRTDLPLNVGYLGKSGQWSVIPAQIVRRLDGRPHGDVAIVSVDRGLPSIKFATNQNSFSAKDEVFIAGVQSTAPPAIIAIGIIESVNAPKHEFKVKGWGWFGFSGGPIFLRKTGEVIGYTAWSAKGHIHDAMKSECADLTHFIGLLKACGLDDLQQAKQFSTHEDELLELLKDHNK